MIIFGIHINCIPDNYFDFDCGSHMHSFLLLYYNAVLLLVILPGSLFDCGTSWHSFQF